MNTIAEIIEKARQFKGTVVLPEGMDPRVIKAACAVKDRGIAEPVVLGTAAEIADAEAKAGLSLAERGIKTLDYTSDPLGEELAAIYLEAWNRKESRKPPEKQKIIDAAAALKTLRTKRIYFGGMMVKTGRVHGLVAGSIASTGDMLRAAFHTIGTQPGTKLASSCFLMDLAKPTPAGDGTLAFADCAVNPNPTAEQLVDIAFASAQTFKALTGKEPRVAFLSYSTKGSAAGELVDKVRQAVEIAGPRFAEAGIAMDGEMQLDAALVKSVAELKNPGGAIQGDANVLVFPDLQAGNIGYKLVQRLAGAEAVGPVLQGLAKPLNDLSRGCSAEDIVGTVAIAMLQAKALES